MKLRRVFVLMSCLLLSACSGDPASETGKNKGDEPTKNIVEPKVTASVKNLAEIEELIASHKGKIVVVDLWAMW